MISWKNLNLKRMFCFVSQSLPRTIIVCTVSKIKITFSVKTDSILIPNDFFVGMHHCSSLNEMHLGPLLYVTLLATMQCTETHLFNSCLFEKPIQKHFYLQKG